MPRVRLVRLEIEDYELIERAELAFADGLTICSGETGSGKTMLLGALDFVLGERSSADVVRQGAARARVTLAVDADVALRAKVAAQGFESDDDEAIVLVREMLATGKSTARVNGSLATSAQVRDLARTIVESIGQHEQQRLLAPGFALDALDAYAGDAAREARQAVALAYDRATIAASRLDESENEAGRAVAEFEAARSGIAEIDAAGVVAGEDAALRERRAYLADVQKIRSALETAHAALAGEANAAVEALGVAASALSSVARYAAPLAALAKTVAALQDDVQDSAMALAREIERSDFDPGEGDAVGARLDLLERLKKKYGGDLVAVGEARARFAALLDRDASRDERIAALRAQASDAQLVLVQQATALSDVRRTAARELEVRVARELEALAMPAARFAVDLQALAAPGPLGAETAEFALSPNPGEPLRPLVRAASGGELSRVLLALVVASAADRAPTPLVFDEIDAGIGGATAAAVGTRLGALARASQVVCVTHLAQIASWADRHFVLRKRERKGATIVELVALEDRPAVVEELARMLSGSTASVALEHAETLVREVRARKAKTKLSA